MAKGNELVEKDSRSVDYGRGGKHNFPTSPEVGEGFGRYIRSAKTALDLPPIDIADINQCKQRVSDYFDYCAQNNLAPTLVGVAAWLGISRDTLHTWRTGECRAATHTDYFKRVATVIEDTIINASLNRQCDNATAIYMLKALHGLIETLGIITPANASTIGDRLPEDIIAEYKDVVDVPEDD